MKVVVFGAGTFGKKYIEEREKNIEIVAVVDNRANNIEPSAGGGVSANSKSMRA